MTITRSGSIAAALMLASAAPAQDTGVEQIGERSTQLDAPVVGDRSVQPSTSQQLTSKSESGVPDPQLTGERGATGPGPQLSSGDRSADGAPALSRTSDGRTGVAQRIGGRDRCDEDAERRSAACAQVIETRAAEFKPPEETPLSPEQRLLVDQRLRAGPMTAQNASRRSATGLNPDSIEEQGLASIALGSGAPPRRDDEPAESEDTLSAEAQALINAIVRNATGTPNP